MPSGFFRQSASGVRSVYAAITGTPSDLKSSTVRLPLPTCENFIALTSTSMAGLPSFLKYRSNTSRMDGIPADVSGI